jgi:hypothetical protein
MVMVMRLRGKHPRLEARLPTYVAAVMVATLAHMPSSGSFRSPGDCHSPVIRKSINAADF